MQSQRTDTGTHAQTERSRGMGRLSALLALVPVLWLGCETSRAQPTRQPKAAATASKEPAVKRTYAKPSVEELKRRLTPEQLKVTQQAGTEPPFRNAYWDNHAPGIYVDIVSGEPLFSSLDKFDSGTGWPSFKKPLEAQNIVERSDTALGMRRTEVRSKHGDSHLGHVFDDGPAPTGQRFCMNSASLKFIPADKLLDEGYGQYAHLFPGSVKAAASKTQETALLAGGCFWGMENILRSIPGVVDTEVGYTGGELGSPSYDDVTTGRTGHAESVRVTFNPQVLSYEALLGYFFRMHDPTTLNRQENDVGTQYRSAIFYLNDDQKRVAEAVKERVNKSGKWKQPVVTQIAAAGKFWTAEAYHQDYLVNNPNGYNCHVLRD